MKEKGNGGKLGRWLGAPVRALSRACDSYVRRMSACAGRMPTHAGTVGRAGFGPGAVQAATFSSRSRRGGGGGGGEEEDLNELVRAMSLRQRLQAAPPDAEAAAAVPVRSRSVAVGRIDEDAPCEFGAADARVGPVMPAAAVRRSRSVAVPGAARLPPRPGAKKAAGGVVHG